MGNDEPWQWVTMDRAMGNVQWDIVTTMGHLGRQAYPCKRTIMVQRTQQSCERRGVVKAMDGCVLSLADRRVLSNVEPDSSRPSLRKNGEIAGLSLTPI